jgi:hypothetical protein
MKMRGGEIDLLGILYFYLVKIEKEIVDIKSSKNK